MKNIREHCFRISYFNRNKVRLLKGGLSFILFLICNLSVYAQSFTVKGKVLDANDEPLIGAAIVLKSQSTVGTVADFDGNFTLEVPDKDSSRCKCEWP